MPSNSKTRTVFDVADWMDRGMLFMAIGFGLVVVALLVAEYVAGTAGFAIAGVLGIVAAASVLRGLWTE